MGGEKGVLFRLNASGIGEARVIHDVGLDSLADLRWRAWHSDESTSVVARIRGAEATGRRCRRPVDVMHRAWHCCTPEKISKGEKWLKKRSSTYAK